jgi:hypothetical protein
MLTLTRNIVRLSHPTKSGSSSPIKITLLS